MDNLELEYCSLCKNGLASLFFIFFFLGGELGLQACWLVGGIGLDTRLACWRLHDHDVTMCVCHESYFLDSWPYPNRPSFRKK